VPIGLLLRITDAERDTRVAKTFAHFPVRIGRSPLNDLQLNDSHVSQFHAVIERAEDALLLRDLGSRNGTRVVSGRAPAHEAISLEKEQNTFFIANLKFEVALGPVQVKPPRRTIVGAAPPNTLAQTRLLDEPSVVKRLAFGSEPGTEPKPNLASTVAFNPADYGTKTIDPEARARQLEAVTLQAVRELAAAFLPGRTLETSEDVLGFLSRVRDTVDVFTRCFIPLRDGYREFTTQMTIERRGSSVRPVDGAQNERDLAVALLDWTNDDTGVQTSIEGTFADLMIHQLALLNAIMRGVKSLLNQLAPRSIDRALGELANQGKAGFTWGPWRFKELWRLYGLRYGDVDDGDKRTFTALFGPEFAEAYGQFRSSAGSDNARDGRPEAE
jgi:type VI secretion system protein ImpI